MDGARFVPKVKKKMEASQGQLSCLEAEEALAIISSSSNLNSGVETKKIAKLLGFFTLFLGTTSIHCGDDVLNIEVTTSI